MRYKLSIQDTRAVPTILSFLSSVVTSISHFKDSGRHGQLRVRLMHPLLRVLEGLSTAHECFGSLEMASRMRHLLQPLRYPERIGRPHEQEGSRARAVATPSLKPFRRMSVVSWPEVARGWFSSEEPKFVLFCRSSLLLDLKGLKLYEKMTHDYDTRWSFGIAWWGVMIRLRSWIIGSAQCWHRFRYGRHWEDLNVW